MTKLNELDIPELGSILDTLERQAFEHIERFEGDHEMLAGFYRERIEEQRVRLAEVMKGEDPSEELVRFLHEDFMRELGHILKADPKGDARREMLAALQAEADRLGLGPIENLDLIHPLMKPYYERIGFVMPKFLLPAHAELVCLPGSRLMSRWIKERVPLVGGALARVVDKVLGVREIDRDSWSIKAAREVLKKQGVHLLESDLDYNGKPLKAPVRHASVEHIGMYPEALKEELGGVFDDLEWDEYDVKRMWIEAIQEHVAEAEQYLPRLKQFYYGEIELAELSDITDQLPTDVRANLEKVEPWRRRAIAKFKASGAGGVFNVEPMELGEFAQGDSDDMRSWPRQFAEIPQEVQEGPHFQGLLKALFGYVQRMDSGVEEIEITSHLMGLFVRPGQEVSNAPEGPHQDEADYIISALVIVRENVDGGETVIYVREADGTLVEIYRATLQEGEFLVQADEASGELHGDENTLFHNVTKCRAVNPTKPGVRHIIGFDVKVTKRNWVNNFRPIPATA